MSEKFKASGAEYLTVLGIGGIRILQAAQYNFDVIHMNEGHALPAAFELLRMYNGNLDKVKEKTGIDFTDKNLTYEEALKIAKEKGIPVIAYDRLLMDTDAVSYYATFDNKGVGTVIAKDIEAKKNLKTAAAEGRSYTIEFFMGSPDDNNINFFFGGAMDVLKPYLDSGVLVCRSGQTSKAQCATLNWSTEEAQKRMENLITSNKYGPKGTKLDAIPLGQPASTGQHINLISHPKQMVYTYTQGYVTRNTVYNFPGKPILDLMEISADFAEGSSGGPIMDDMGNLVGMVKGTTSIFYDAEKRNPQMVLKVTIPIKPLRRLMNVK